MTTGIVAVDSDIVMNNVRHYRRVEGKLLKRRKIVKKMFCLLSLDWL